MALLTINDIFDKIDSVTRHSPLQERDKNVLRLLGEEMFGMAEHLVKGEDDKFWIEYEGNSFELHLSVEAKVSPEQKKEFISISTKKENTAAKGLKGKIRNMFEDFLYLPEGATLPPETYGVFIGEHYDYYNMWSMSAYMQQAPVEHQKEDYDGLEKSILINMADDIIIGATGKRVDMIVKKKFS